MAHLTFSHRQQIAEGIRTGNSNARIARELGVHPSTVGREIARNAETREQYAAQYAHNMAACRQIRAARDRFICAAEVYVPAKYQPNRSPFSELTLPPLYYGRPMFIGGYGESFFQNTYYYNSYPAFTRFDQVPAIFKFRSILSTPRAVSSNRSNSTLPANQSFSENRAGNTGFFKRGNDMVTSCKIFSEEDQNVFSSLSMPSKVFAFSRVGACVFQQNIPSAFHPKYFNCKKPLLMRGESLVHFSKAGEKFIFLTNSYLHPSRHMYFFSKNF